MNAYRADYEFTNGEFESDYFYTRTYSYSYRDNNVQLGSNPRAVKEQCDLSGNNLAGQWGSTDFNAIVDGDKSSDKGRIHTGGGSVNNGRPITLTVDLGEACTVNRLIFYSTYRPNGDWYTPQELTIKGSLDGMNYTVLKEFTGLTRTATIVLDFDKTDLRYYQVVITKDWGNGIIVNEFEMWNINEVNGGTHYSPDDGMFNYEGAWHGKQISSTFGHVLVGEKGAKMKFEFEGTRIGILSSSALEQNFEVYIDGKKVDSIALKEDNGATVMTYLCDALPQGKHTVEVRCTGVANIDSIVVYP